MSKCQGSLRGPGRTVVLPNGANWGICRFCREWMPLNRHGEVKPHVVSRERSAA